MGSKKTLKSSKKRLLEVDPVQKDCDIDGQKNQQARMSWKLKYELINSDQFNNGTDEDKDSSDEEDVVNERRESAADEKKAEVVRKEPKQKTTVIAGLSGYLSTSDSNDCSSDEEVDIQREVQAFLKEVDSIKLDVDGNPLESSFEKKTEQKCPSEAAAIDQQHQAMRDYYAAHGYTMPSTSWQECYDASSGYSYYWNTETNEVIWEIPAEYQFYINTVKQQWEEYHRALYSNQYSTSSQNMIHSSRIGTSTPLKTLAKSANNVNQSAGITSKGSSSSHSKKTLTQVSPKTVSHAKGKRKEPYHSDSEDEKIELITSYGPNSDDQSSDEEEENVKGKKRRHSQDSKDKDSSHPSGKKKSYKSRTPPPGVDEDLEEIEKQIELKKRQANRQEDVKKLLAMKKEEAIRNKKKQLNASEEDPAKKQTNIEISNSTTSASSPESQNVPLVSYKPELPSEDNVPSPGEAELVERLKSQAELLKRLGGELPEGVSQIISEKLSESESKKGSSLVPGYGEDVDSESDGKVSPEMGKEVCEQKTIKLEAAKETVTKLVDKDDKTKQDVKQVAAAGERVSKRVLKLSAKAKQLINASETTKRARQTDFVNTPLGLRPADPSNIEHLDGTPISLDEGKSNNENENNSRTGLGFSSESSEKSSQAVSGETVNEEGENSIGDKEISIQDCLELLQGKMKFLCEGKEPPSPVQIWAEQLEILFKAWESKQLKDEFLSHWLQTISERLTQLESTAAPPGWLCLWSREERRYYYKGAETGDIVWEFPTSEAAKDNLTTAQSKDEEEVTTDIDGVEEAMDLGDGQGEVEMDLCLTPPPPSSPPSPPPPPVISTAPSAPSPPPPPLISFPPDGSLPENVPPLPEETPPPLPEEAPPPLPDEAPPLPMDEAPPLPPGEPLPPGVEPPQSPPLLMMPSVAPAPTPVPPPLPHRALLPHPSPQDTYGHMVMTSTPYHMAYHQMHYGTQSQYPSAYVSAAPMPAPVPPKVEGEKQGDLSSELSSFYSDLASLGPEDNDDQATAITSTGSGDDLAVASLDSPDPPLPSSSPDPTAAKKRKKPKLAPGLALKKKGVSSLVAKWQKVQQSTRRDF